MTPELSTKKEKDWALWIILLVAFLFRFLYLGLKPPHFDEGINGWFVDQMISNGYYSYDPTNYHGPFHFYVLWVFKFFFGRNLWGLRLSASVFGLAGIYLVTQLKPFVGKFTAYATAGFLAVSPGMTFYTRYAIHESELFFFMILSLLGFLRLLERKDKRSIWEIGLGITGMIITKETFIVHLVCFGLAFLCMKIYELMFRPRPLAKRSKVKPVAVVPQYTMDDVGTVFLVCSLIFVTFYSGFFLHIQGVSDFFRSFEAWFGTGQKGNGHQKPFWYWLELFERYEWVALIGLVLSLRQLFPGARRWTRLIGIYGTGTLLAYSIVSYKTPWCILSIVWPFYFLTADLLSEIAARGPRLAYGAFGAVVALSLPAAAYSVNVNFFKYEDETEPYVYVQTFSDIMRIDDKLLDLAKKDPSNYHMSIKLFMDSNWPLPWLFGDFDRAAYYGAPNANDPNADLILVDEKYAVLIETRLQKPYFKQHFKVRSAQEAAIAYFDVTTFKDEFPADFPRFTPRPPEPVVPGQGLLAQYFTNAAWTGAPIFTKTMAAPSFVWSDGERPLPAPFGILLSGEIMIPETGDKYFYLSSDDGSDLFIDGKKIIDNQGAHADSMKSGGVTLTRGWHPLQIHYNDFGGGMALRLWWNNANGYQDDIDPKYFRFRSTK